MMARIRVWIVRAAAGAVLFCVAVPHGRPQAPLVDPRSVAPFVPAPWHVVDKMLSLVEVAEDDVVYDLGSGDGRILVRAAKGFGAKGVGLEINPALVEDARQAIEAANVQHRVKIVQQDIFEADLSPATVVTLFLMTSAHRRLEPKLQDELRPGTRIACYKWELPDWNPIKTETVPVGGVGHPIYIYEIGSHR